MKFVVSRSKVSLTGTKKPCEEAVEEDLTLLDYRDVKTLEEAKSKIWYKEWFEGGENHREEAGMVVCDRKAKTRQWVINLDNLEDLVSFQDKYGDIIITDSSPYKEARKEIIIQGTKR